MADLVLFTKEGYALKLLGALQGNGDFLTTDFSVGTAANAKTFPLALMVPKLVVGEKDGSFYLKRPNSEVASVELEATVVATNEFLGVGWAGLAITFRLGATMQDLERVVVEPLVIEICGTVDLDFGTANAGVKVECCFEIVPELPDLTLPNITFPRLPKLRIRLPGFGFTVPTIDIPWPEIDWPTLPALKLPSFPLRLPSFRWPGIPQLSIPPPIWISWRGVQISKSGQKIILDVTALCVQTWLGSRTADVHLVFDQHAKLILTECWIDLYTPDENHKTRLKEIGWHLDRTHGCLGVSWTEDHLEGWLELLMPMLAGLLPRPKKGDKLSVRIIKQMKDRPWEVRIDEFRSTAEPTILPLLGFKAKLPAAELRSLVIGPGTDNKAPRVRAILTVAKDQTASLETTFSLASSDQREVLPSSSEKDEPLLFLEMKAKDRVSLVLADVPVGEGKPQFFRQAKTALSWPAWHPAVECAGIGELVPFSLGSWEKTQLTLNQSKLPLLSSGDPSGVLDTVSQYLEVKPSGPPKLADNPPSITCEANVTLKLDQFGFRNDGVGSKVDLAFSLDDMAFKVGAGPIAFKSDNIRLMSLLGLEWAFHPAPGFVEGKTATDLFQLSVQGRHCVLGLAAGAKVEVWWAGGTSEDSPLRFEVSEFYLGPNGIMLTARVTPSPAKLRGVNTRFSFTAGELKIRDNKLQGFSIEGEGDLPPALVGEAKAKIAIQFGQDKPGGRLKVVSGAAELRTNKTLKCPGTRFQFKLDALGLRFVDDGHCHFYFTVTGTARFVPMDSDNPNGALAWLAKTELKLQDAPLTGDWSVLRKHVKFVADLPKKVKFSLLGCFEFEIRGIGFVPDASEQFGDPIAAMQIAGQIRFALDGGDVIDARVDFHSLYVGLPSGGSFLPRLYCRNLGVRLKVASAFDLEGYVDLLNGDEIEPGWRAHGFRGKGALTIMSLPRLEATFAFVRVAKKGALEGDSERWVRAWFIYLGLGRLSLQIPVLQIYLRQVGLGFGYRYTLASIKAADEIDDPKQLLKKLKTLTATQANLNDFAQWRLDVEERGETPRWTVALKAVFCDTTASSLLSYNAQAEKNLQSLFMFDAALAFRSDFTFYMSVRGWLWTNYDAYLNDKNEVRSHPLLAGFMLLSAPRRRFLAHVCSLPDAQFGNLPAGMDILVAAIRASRFSATMLIEPGLFHAELGWPNSLGWSGHYGPMKLDISGGLLNRLSWTEAVQGLSFFARGSLEFSVEASIGCVGARLWATAKIAFGARFLAVLAFDRPFEKSAIYLVAGLDIQVKVGVAFWIRIKIGFCRITLRWGFSFELAFTAVGRIGLTPTNLLGAVGTASLELRIMGFGLRFNVHVGINEGAVRRAEAITAPFMKVGLEGTEVEAIPGTEEAPKISGGVAPAALSTPGAPLVAPAPVAHDEGHTSGIFHAPDYTLFLLDDKDESYFVILPQEGGFLPPPRWKDGTATKDYEWIEPALNDFTHFDHETSVWKTIKKDKCEWSIAWETEGATTNPNGKEEKVVYSKLMRAAFAPKDPAAAANSNNMFEDDAWCPHHDPERIQATSSSERDQRVTEPTEAAYEAAVRRASAQVESSPYFKHDPESSYEQALLRAYQSKSNPYPGTPSVSEEPASPISQGEEGSDDQNADPKATQNQQAFEFRSLFVHRLMQDLEEYVTASDDDRKKMELSNPAFRCGLVFKGDRDKVHAFVASPQSGLRQRIADDADTMSAADQRVVCLNLPQRRFADHPPVFAGAKLFASHATVAISWDLEWDVPSIAGYNDYLSVLNDPEEQLRYYRVIRQPLSTDGTAREFRVRPCGVVAPREKAPDQWEVIRARFQFIDNFDEESNEEVDKLSDDGRKYLYTVIPVDVSGTASSEPLTLLAHRKPVVAPPTINEPLMSVVMEPVNSAMLIAPANTTTKPTALKPKSATLTFRKPAATHNGKPIVETKSVVIVFRPETLSGGGVFGADAAGGQRRLLTAGDGIRVIPGDIVCDEQPFTDTPNKPGWVSVALKPEDLKRLGTDWKPQSWRVLVAARSSSQAVSALVPVEMAMDFALQATAARTMRRYVGALEWPAMPALWPMLGFEDALADAGTAQIARHKNNSFVWDLQKDDLPLHFDTLPAGTRALSFRWNRWASRLENPTWQPVVSGFDILEFDCDETTADKLDPTEISKVEPYLRQALDIELLPPGEALLRPAENLTPDLWKAWYPSTARRYANAIKVPGRPDAPCPWFSWRESYQQWPETKSWLTGSTTPIPAPRDIVMAEHQDGWKVTVTHPNEQNLAVGDFVQFTGDEVGELQSAGAVQIVDEKDGGWIFEKRAFLKAKSGKGQMLRASELHTSAELKKDDGGQWVMRSTLGKGPFVEIVRQFGEGRCYVRVRALELRTFPTLAQPKSEKRTPRQHCGLKRLVAATVDTLTFETGSFVDEGTLADVVIGMYPHTALIHPFIAKLMDDVSILADTKKDIVGVELTAAEASLYGCYAEIVSGASSGPEGKADPAEPLDLEGLRSMAMPEPDPFGWNALKRLGLSAAIILRNRRTGQPVKVKGSPTSAAVDLVRLALQNYPGSPHVKEMLRHLHVELMMQPARGYALKEEAGSGFGKEQLLALTQLSLRPRPKQHWRYWWAAVKADDPDALKRAREGTLELIVTNAKARSVLACDPASGELCEPVGETLTARVTQNSDGVFRILLRARGDAIPDATWSSNTAPDITAAAVTDHSLPRLPDIEPPAWCEQPAALAHLKVLWDLLRSAVPKMPEWPTELSDEHFSELDKLQEWTRRFFEHSADVSDETKAGPSLATAWLRSPASIGVEPDVHGLMRCVQLHENPWAQNLRYYFRPRGRYDALWQGMAQRIEPQALPKLRDGPFPAGKGAADVVLNRIKSVAPPTLLGTRRVGDDLKDGALTTGDITEITLAMHSEQVLADCNVTVTRRLEWVGVSLSLQRQFAFSNQLACLGKPIEPSGPVTSRAPKLSTEALVVDEDDPRLRVDERAQVLTSGTTSWQFESLPFFYRLRISAIARAVYRQSEEVNAWHSDFAFQSPKLLSSKATGPRWDVNESTATGPRTLRLDLPLASLWDSTPENVKARWKQEAPLPKELRPAILPDPEVRYYLSLAGPEGSATRLHFAELEFAENPTTAANMWNAKVVETSETPQLQPVAGETSQSIKKDANFRLAVDLSGPPVEVELSPHKPMTSKVADLPPVDRRAARHDKLAMELPNFGGNEAESDEFFPARVFTVRWWNGAMLPYMEELPGGHRLHLRYLPNERPEMPPGLSDADKLAWQRLFSDVTNEAKLNHAFSASVPAPQVMLVANMDRMRIEPAPNLVLEVHWHRADAAKLKAQQETLLKASQDEAHYDTEMRIGFGSLLRMVSSPDVVARVDLPAGPDMVGQIADDAHWSKNGDGTEWTWNGPVSPAQMKSLRTWAAGISGAPFAKLIVNLDAFTADAEVAVAALEPAPQMEPLLAARLDLAASATKLTLRWKGGLLLRAAERRMYGELIAGLPVASPWVDGLKQLWAKIEGAAVIMAWKKPDALWDYKAREIDAAHKEADVHVLRAVATFQGWMTAKERSDLKTVLTVPGLHQLHRQSLRHHIGDGNMQVQARRSLCTPTCEVALRHPSPELPTP